LSAGLLAVALITSAALEFEWNAPSTCPTVEIVRARLGPLSGKASATVVERATGWHLEVHANEAVRTLVTATCDEAAEAAVLIVRLALAEAPRVAEDVAPAPAIVVAPVAERSPPSWRVHVGATGGAVAAWLPQVLVRFGLTGVVDRGPLVFLLQAHTGLRQRYAGGPTPTSAVALQLLVEAEAGACWAFGSGRFRAGPCVAGGAGLVLVEGLNVSTPRSVALVVAHGGPGARASFEVTEWFEVMASAFARATARPQVSFEGSQTVVASSWLAVELSAGVGLIW
jgi:hypothetical protein